MDRFEITLIKKTTTYEIIETSDIETAQSIAEQMIRDGIDESYVEEEDWEIEEIRRVVRKEKK